MSRSPGCERLRAGLARIAWTGALAAVAAMVCLGLCEGPVGAEEGTGTPAGPPTRPTAAQDDLRFQRVFVPADRIERQASGGRYLPIGATEFDRLAKEAADGDAEAMTGSPRITAAEYHASLTPDGVLRGTATLVVDASGERAEVLSLGVLRSAITDARWEDSRSTTTIGTGDGGDVRLLVEKPGQLRFAWSLAPRPGGGAARVFDVDLPPSAKTTLLLETSETMAAACEPGICMDAEAATAGRKSWCFELGGRTRAVLRITPADAATAAERQPDVTTSLVYVLREQGLDVKAEVRFEGPIGPPRHLHLRLDPGLELVTAHYGQTPVGWSASTEPEERSTQVVVELPETSQGTAQVLHLAAMGQVALDRPWRLPRVWPAGVFWREGDATLAVTAPLVLERLVPIEGRQSRSASPAASGGGERSEFQFFSPDATIELVAARRHAPAEFDYGVSVELDGSEVAGRLIAMFYPGGRERFELVGRVQRPWIVDEVECETPGYIRDWAQSSDKDGKGRLVIRLAKALKPGGEPLQITVTGRRLQSPLGHALGADDLTPVQFHSKDVRSGTGVLAVRTHSPYKMSITGDRNLRRIAVGQERKGREQGSGSREQGAGDSRATAGGKGREQDQGIVERLSALPGDFAFVRDSAAEDLRVELAQERPGYACDVHVRATVSRETLLESYRFRCEPRSSPMDRVLIHFLPARDARLQWSLDSAGEQPLAARRMTAKEQAAAGIKGEGETWSIALLPTRSEPFEIRADRVTPWAGPATISLAGLPEADSQTGRVLVGADGDVPVKIVNRRLDPVPTEPPPRGEYQTGRATFRYRPETLIARSSGAVTVAVGEKSEERVTAVAWKSRIDSRFAACGGAEHVATYHLENTGRPQFSVRIAAGTRRRRVREVSVDGRTASWRREADTSGNERLVIDLPPARRFPVVALDVSEDHPPLGMADTLEPPGLEPDIPVMAARWVAWVPAGYRANASEECSGGRGDFSWRERLFGPLGRSAKARPFNPAAAEHWRRLVGGASEGAEQGIGEQASTGISTSSAGDTIGWNSYCLDLGGSRPVELRVVHNLGIEVTRWVAFLAAVGLGMWTSGTRPRQLATAAAISAAAAIVLPTLPATVASGGLLAMLFCLVAGLLRRWPRDHWPDRSSAAYRATLSSRHMAAAPTESLAPLLLAAAVLCGSRGATTADAAVAPANRGGQPAAAPAQVLIPIDEQRKPSGGDVYVPESLYRRLTRAVDGRRVPRGWLIERTSYRGEITWDKATRRLVPGLMRASFHIRAFDAGTPVRIPLRRNQLTTVEPWAFLDGRPIEPEWEPDGRALLLDVPSEGHYRLELVFTPVVGTATGAADRELARSEESGFDISIPPVVNSQLRLAFPAGARAVKTPSARGRVVAQDQQLSAELGGTETLSVRWPADAAPQETPPAVEADQLVWMNVTSGSVLVDVRFHVRVIRGNVSEMRWTIDPRLTLLGKPSIGWVESVPGSPERLRVKLPAPQTGHFELAARFSLEASGVGRHRLPLVRLDDARVDRRWFAISVDDALRYVENSPTDTSADKAEARSTKGLPRGAGASALGIERVAVPDFLAAWGDAPQWTARSAYRYSGEAPPWNVATSPREGRTVVDQQLAATFGQREAELRYGAWIGTSAGSGFRYRLHVPPEFEVDSLVVREDGADRLSRWTRTEDGSIALALTAPAAAPRQLVLRGRMAVSAGVVDLPIPRIEDAESRFFRVTLLRRSPVLLELERCEGLEEAEPEVLSADQAANSRLFVSLVNSGQKKPRVRVRVAANRPKLHVRQMLSMETRSDAWVAKTQIETELRDGVADEIRLIVPDELGDPVEIEPPASVTQTALPGGRREVVLRGPRPIMESQQWSLVFPLASERVAVPDIAVADATSHERRLVLPHRLGRRDLRWDTQRLERESDNRYATIYRAVDNGFRAVLLPPGGTANVSLADVRLAWAEDGTCQGVVHFELDAAPRDGCSLVLPRDYRIVLLSVDGVPTLPDSGRADEAGPDGARRIRIPLKSPTLPARITIAFTGRLAAEMGRGGRLFDVPRLGTLPVEKTIWTLSGPPGWKVAGRPNATLALFDVLRADSLSGVIERAANGDAVRSDKQCWARAQLERFRRIEAALLEHLGRGEPAAMAQAVDKTLQALRRQWAGLGAACTDSNHGDEFKNGDGTDSGGASKSIRQNEPLLNSSEAGEAWLAEIDEPGASVYRIVATGLDPLTVGYRRTSASWTAARASGVLLVGMLVAAGYLGIVRGVWRAMIRHWPEGFIVAAGVAWWLLLSPSAAGLLIALSGVWLTIRFAGRRFRSGHSTVVSSK